MKKTVSAVIAGAAMLTAACGGSGSEPHANARLDVCLQALDAGEDLLGISLDMIGHSNEVISIAAEIVGETNPLVLSRAADRIGGITEQVNALGALAELSDYDMLAAACRGEGL